MAELPLLVMPWHRPDPCKPVKMQTKAAFQKSYIDYLSTLSLESPPLAVCLTTIMCTIGNASKNVDTMVDLMEQGMSIALVPLSIGTRQEHVTTIANLRTANTAFSQVKNRVYPLGIAVQTKGPGLRIGALVKDMPIELMVDHKVCLSIDPAFRQRGTIHYLYIIFPEMCEVLTEGDTLTIGHNKVTLQVTLVVPSQGLVECLVTAGGVVQSFMPVTVPEVPVCLPPLTTEDEDDLKMAAELGLDIVVASQTRTAGHVASVRRILEDNHAPGVKVWAQIESKEGLDNLLPIIEVADAILFSRITLLKDIPPEKLFIAQKTVTGTCNKMGIPVFLSSHYLCSMEADRKPSVAEMADVAAAVTDGADGFLTRRTTTTGAQPAAAVRALRDVCLEAEAAVWHHQTFAYLSNQEPPPVDPTHAIAVAAVDASLRSAAAAIFLVTTSGRSAQVVARYRPRCPVIAVTRYGQVARQLNSWRAVTPLHYVDPPLPEWPREVDVRLQFGIEYAKLTGMVKPGDCLVLMNGWRQGAGFTNTIRVVYASDSFPWVYPHRLPKELPAEPEEEAESTARTGLEAMSNITSQRPAVDKSNTSVKIISTVTSRSTSTAPVDVTASVKTMRENFKAITTSGLQEISNQSLKTVYKSNSNVDRKPTITNPEPPSEMSLSAILQETRLDQSASHSRQSIVHKPIPSDDN